MNMAPSGCVSVARKGPRQGVRRDPGEGIPLFPSYCDPYEPAQRIKRCDTRVRRANARRNLRQTLQQHADRSPFEKFAGRGYFGAGPGPV